MNDGGTNAEETGTSTSGDDAGGDGDGDSTSSAGCGLAPADALGGVQLTIDAGAAGDGERGFFLSLPDDYDPDVPHAVVVGYAGTNWVGSMIQPYLDLEQEGAAEVPEIFVYPDPLWRDFDGWGNLGGWVLGPHAAPANGNGDLVLTEAILDYLEENYCVDTSRVFATGHSWGGDMAAVAGCFLGDRFTGTVPVAANRPYWFEPAGGGSVDCVGDAAVWTMFGVADDHFTWQDYPGQFGDEQRDFWLQARGCDGVDAATDLGLGQEGECLQFEGCSAEVLYCLYGPAAGHQIPSYFAQVTMAFFRSL